MKRTTALFTGASLLLVAGSLIPFFLTKTMHNKNAYRLKEPMLISSSNGEPYYMIPTNTVLHYQKGFAEGHQLYTIEVFFKGALPAEQLSSPVTTESTWLYQLDADDVQKALHRKHSACE